VAAQVSGAAGSGHYPELEAGFQGESRGRIADLQFY
jgi:hypothetical protein